LLVSGIVRVASTLAGICVLGVAFDLLFGLPRFISGPWRLFGFLPITVGIALESAGTFAFWKYGEGTPNPDAHPPRLVVEGPYSWSRHPLYLARHLALIGAAWVLSSLSILVLTFLLFLVVQEVMIPREEQRLAVRFGKPYDEYRSRVSRWVTLRRGRHD